VQHSLNDWPIVLLCVQDMHCDFYMTLLQLECCLFFAAFMIAGNTAEYVNSELEKVAKRLVSVTE